MYINSNQKRKRKHFWKTPPCRSARYVIHESCIHRNQKPKARASLVDGRCIKRDQKSNNISGAVVYQPRCAKQKHIRAVYEQKSKSEAQTRLDDIAASITAMYRPLSAKKQHIQRSCISYKGHSCISTAFNHQIESTSGRHHRVDQRGISTARAVYKCNSKTKVKALLVDTFV